MYRVRIPDKPPYVYETAGKDRRVWEGISQGQLRLVGKTGKMEQPSKRKKGMPKRLFMDVARESAGGRRNKEQDKMEIDIQLWRRLIEEEDIVILIIHISLY